MSKRHRLRALQVGVPRHNGILVILRRHHQRALQLTVSGQQFEHRVFAPQFKIGCHLIITATPGMQFFTQRPDFIDELTFYPAVNIFCIALQDLLWVETHLFQQSVQRLFQLTLFISSQHTDRDQRFGPGHRTNNILLGQAVIEAQRVVELFEPLIRCLCKTPTPKCHNEFP